MLNSKLEALKMVLIEEYGWNIEEIKEEGIGNIAEDFLILTDAEADAAAWESLEDYIEDYGYNFNVNLDYYVNEDIFRDFFEESYWCYIQDIKLEKGRLKEEIENAEVKTEEEYHEYLMNSISDYAEEYKYQFGQEEFYRMLRDNNAIDQDRLIDDIIINDGRGAILASYDGVEHEININNKWFYIYKIN